jgi:hypothetical protein
MLVRIRQLRKTSGTSTFSTRHRHPAQMLRVMLNAGVIERTQK